MVDLKIKFSGYDFINPFILASSPATRNAEMIKRGFDAGWAGAVTSTLILNENDSEFLTNEKSPRLESLWYESFEEEDRKIFAMGRIERTSSRPLSVWLEEISELIKEYPDNILIANIQAEDDKISDWQKLTKLVEKAGAHAVELNFSRPFQYAENKAKAKIIGQDPKLAMKITAAVRAVSDIPIWIKLTGQVNDINPIGRAVKKAGANVITAVGAIPAIIGVDLEHMCPKPMVADRSAIGSLSGQALRPIALRDVYKLSSNVKLSVSGVGGIEKWHHALEFLLLGAGTVQVCTSVLLRGYKIVSALKSGLLDYMEDHSFKNVKKLVGVAAKNVTKESDLDHENSAIAVIDYELCDSCGLCEIACKDGSFNAIYLDETRTPVINKSTCSGCSLCIQVCPVTGCITMKDID